MGWTRFFRRAKWDRERLEELEKRIAALERAPGKT